jgi:hypothetical protein
MTVIRDYFIELIAMVILIFGSAIGFCLWLIMDSWRSDGTDT